MKRIVIYARGRLLNRYIKNIKWKEVIVIADKSAESGEIYKNKAVIHPDNLVRYQYDYIAVFSDRYFDEIYAELVGSYYIPAAKIISWRAVTGVNIPKFEFANFLQKYLNSDNFVSILDCHPSPIYQTFMTKESLSEKIVRLDRIGQCGCPVMKNLYDHKYMDLANVDFSFYDLALLWEKPEPMEIIGQIMGKSRSCLILMNYAEAIEWDIDNKVNILKQYGNVQLLKNNLGCIIKIEKKSAEKQFNTRIYVVTHKKYNIKNDDLYKPICVGDNYYNETYLSEKNGDNISALNEKINECTALYWIWKNTKEEYIGLNHYRRYFYDSNMRICGNFLCKETIERQFEKYDILLPSLSRTYYVLEEIRRSVSDEETFKRGYEIIRSRIEEQQPDYIAAFDSVMHGHREYICNLFVMKRDIFEAYCEWLFSFLIDVANQMDVSRCTGNSRRVIGFFAERMLTVWLFRQDLRIKELPILKLF
ncbi:DUF4422 domain-containing protein [Acetatifactor muris]|uniref:DUF4422 domain-containing protein n=1 Tax=Acetatifactor muris TaxID=879566 RepID=A0A2K4ZAM2_9FIRM|nr:DUF4422 domain-containing protein [Acetatifactor muris]MCR2048722.1 DUF4422 domain-containing protein [Acetatifactor muris]SOY27515.1 hypothetical protein AMURIS_00219 [Acetatifactor muris]